MCRLYAFRSTEMTKVECTLVHAQNALIAQSKQDLSGTSHAHGWGVAAFENERPHIERQAWAAYHGEHFARAAARIYSTNVLAHVRRATVGGASVVNTHPFTDGRYVMVHNGTVPSFDNVRPKILTVTSAEARSQILGETDSEHLFAYARSLIAKNPAMSMMDVVRKVVLDAEEWALQVDQNARAGLNLILSDGQVMAGTRLGRSLYKVERTGVYDCEICGFAHIRHDPQRDHRAIVIASEPITREQWSPIADRSVWLIDEHAKLTVEPL